VLEDTLDRSLALAASMDARGFGRRGNLSRAQQVAVRVLSLSALAVFAIGVYLLLSDPALSFVAAIALALGAVEVLLVVRISSLRNVRTRYRRQNLNALDVLVWALAIGVLAFALTGFGGAQ